MPEPQVAAPKQIEGDHLSPVQLEGQILLVELSGGAWMGPVPDPAPQEQ